jgi:hypothetical protein
MSWFSISRCQIYTLNGLATSLAYASGEEGDILLVQIYFYLHSRCLEKRGGGQRPVTEGSKCSGLSKFSIFDRRLFNILVFSHSPHSWLFAVFFSFFDRVHRGRDKIGGVYRPSQLERTLQLYT